jgi:hypothetical protein
MQRTLKVVATLVSLAATASLAQAKAAPGQDTTYLIKGGTVVNPGAAPMPNTDILIRNNRIVAVGPGASAANAKVIDATGKFVYPGMIDANTGIGLQEIGGISTMNLRSEMGQFNPHMKALVALNVESEILGTTRARRRHDGAHPRPAVVSISGQATLINTAGWTWEDLAIVRTAALMINLPGGGGGGGRGGGGGGRGGGAPAGNPAQLQADFDQFMTDVTRLQRGTRCSEPPSSTSSYEGDASAVQEGNPGDHPAGSEQQIRAGRCLGREMERPRRDLRRRRGLEGSAVPWPRSRFR